MGLPVPAGGGGIGFNTLRLGVDAVTRKCPTGALNQAEVEGLMALSCVEFGAEKWVEAIVQRVVAGPVPAPATTADVSIITTAATTTTSTPNPTNTAAALFSFPPMSMRLYLRMACALAAAEEGDLHARAIEAAMRMPRVNPPLLCSGVQCGAGEGFSKKRAREAGRWGDDGALHKSQENEAAEVARDGASEGCMRLRAAGIGSTPAEKAFFLHVCVANPHEVRYYFIFYFISVHLYISYTLPMFSSRQTCIGIGITLTLHVTKQSKKHYG